MGLRAILFDFNGVIINDEAIHQQLVDELLLGENLPPSGNQYQQFCLGRSDRACIKGLLEARGRVVKEEYLQKLIEKKGVAYHQIISQMQELPKCDRIIEFILSLQPRLLSLAVVTGALRKETEYILERLNIRQYFPVIVAGDDIKSSKPSPDGYLLAVEKLNQSNPSLALKPSECLVIEDTPAGIEAGKKAGMMVVGVANTYPFHLLQRQANWCVDHLMDLDLDWIDYTLNQN